MAISKADTQRPNPAKSASELEPRVVALAEQLGRFLGTVQKKADGWLDRDALTRQVTRIRDGAAELLKHVNRGSEAVRKSGAKPAKKAKPATAAPAATVRASRGAVDAPGKRHRKPPPQERIDKHMGEPVGKKMGQKQFRVGKSRGRG